VKFPAGVGLGVMGMDASGDGDDEIALGFAVYQSTFGNPATVKDYTELVEHGKPLPGSVRTTFNGARKDEAAGKKTGASNNSRRDFKPESERKKANKCPYMPKWTCGKCGDDNFYYELPDYQDTTVKAACLKCKQPKKASHAGSVGKPRVVAELYLGAASIEKLIGERVASGV